ISQTPSAKFAARVRLPSDGHSNPGPVFEISQTLSAKSPPPRGQPFPVAVFPLSWSKYVRLMSVKSVAARAFYEAEAIRGDWSVRQLDRQISTQYFERTAHSRQRA